MNLYEKFMRIYMVECLMGSINVSKIILDFDDYFTSETEIEEKTVEFLEYIIKNDIFYLGIGYSNPINLNINTNNLDKIPALVKQNEKEHNIYFSLTEKGKDFANEYIEKHIKSCENIVLLFRKNEYIGCGDILQVANLEYKFNDLDEVKFEISDLIGKLIYLNIIEIGFLENKIFNRWNLKSNYDIRTKIFDEIKELKEYPKNGDIGWFTLTDEGKRVLQEFQLHGGRIRDYWKYPEL